MKKLQYIGITFLVFFLSSSFQKKDFYSQMGQDRFIYEKFFKNKKNGVFVDIGAHDGISHSNTYYFEKKLNWSGICIEPIEECFQKLKKNRKCKCIQGCIAETNGTAQFLRIHGALETEMLSGIYDKYDERHKDRIDRAVKKENGMVELIDVPTYNLNDLLLDEQITKIDYLSLDTEGGELAILKTIDFDRIYIDVISVENNYNDPEFRTFLESKDYSFIKKLYNIDEIYRKNR